MNSLAMMCLYWNIKLHTLLTKLTKLIKLIKLIFKLPICFP